MSSQLSDAPDAAELVEIGSPIKKRIRHGDWTENIVTFEDVQPETRGVGLMEKHLKGREASGLCMDIFSDTLPAWQNGGARKAILTGLHVARGTPGGAQISTLSGVEAQTLFYNGRMVGRVCEDDDARYCMLGDLRSSDTSLPPGKQTEEVFGMMTQMLALAGMNFRDVARTWFYNDHILDWYDEFNRVRTEFFRRHEVTRMPASTGIGVANFAGAALIAKLIAVRPKSGAVKVRQVESPLQCEASNYGSSFSRAMEVADRFARVLYISGTASIEPGGATAFVGDAMKQIRKTMEVVEALLGNARMTIADATRGIAYFRRAEDIPLWGEYCRSRGLTELPVIAAECDVCRDDLLFEIEMDAARAV